MFAIRHLKIAAYSTHIAVLHLGRPAARIPFALDSHIAVHSADTLAPATHLPLAARPHITAPARVWPPSVTYHVARQHPTRVVTSKYSCPAAVIPGSLHAIAHTDAHLTDAHLAAPSAVAHARSARVIPHVNPSPATIATFRSH